MDWVKIGTDLKETKLKVTRGFTRTKDYYFRVRATNEFGAAEPSMPVMVRKVEGKDRNIPMTSSIKN